MSGKFLRVSEGKLPLLQEVLTRRLPLSACLWNIVKLYKNNHYSPHVNTTFYAYNDALNDNSLLFAVQKRMFPTETDQSITLSGPSNLQTVTTSIISAFESVINWTLDTCFCAVEDDLMMHLQLPEMCSRMGTLVHVDPCYMYSFPVQEALTLNFQKNMDETVVRVSPLRKEDALIVTNSWKFAGPGTLERMQDSIERIGSAGVYVRGSVRETVEEEDDNGRKITKEHHHHQDTLASWVTISHGGTINALYTDDTYRRKGFGKLVMKAVTNYAANLGLVPNVQIQDTNQASKLLMVQIGYKYSHRISWVIYRVGKEQFQLCR